MAFFRANLDTISKALVITNVEYQILVLFFQFGLLKTKTTNIQYSRIVFTTLHWMTCQRPSILDLNQSFNKTGIILEVNLEWTLVSKVGNNNIQFATLDRK